MYCCIVRTGTAVLYGLELLYCTDWNCCIVRTGTAVLYGLELLSAEHLLFDCVPRQYLAIARCSKSIPVSAQRTLTLQSYVQYKCRLSVKCSISVYARLIDQWLSKRGPRLPWGLRGVLRGILCRYICVPVVRYKENSLNRICSVFYIICLSWWI